MKKYTKSTGRLIEKFLTKEEAEKMECERMAIICDVYRNLAPTSLGIQERFDELTNNDYLITIPVSALKCI